MYGGVSVLGLRSAEAPFSWFLRLVRSIDARGRGFDSCPESPGAWDGISLPGGRALRVLRGRCDLKGGSVAE